MAMIVAECGINYGGDMGLAKQMIREAAENGADLVKFQLYSTEALHPAGSKYYDISKRNELTFEQAKMLFGYGKEIGIEVFFSVCDVERVGWCEEIGVGRYKIPSRVQDPLVIKAIADTNKPVLASANSYLAMNNPQIECDWLYCIPEYPAELKELPDFEKDWQFIGFSDHTIGLDAAKIALARRAEVIEKHFCLTREGQEDNPDIAGSMTPDELRELKDFALLVEKVL